MVTSVPRIASDVVTVLVSQLSQVDAVASHTLSNITASGRLCHSLGSLPEDTNMLKDYAVMQLQNIALRTYCCNVCRNEILD
eukprot:1511941-Amphidinium_carterae.1